MKLSKKFLSLVLVILLAFNTSSNTLALGEDVHVLVVGTDGAKEKFSRIYCGYGTKSDRSCWPISERNGALVFDCFRNQDGFNSEDYTIIVVAVDADKEDIEEVQKDVKNALDGVCNSKSPYAEVVVAFCTDRFNVKTNDFYFARLNNYVSQIESVYTESGLGSSRGQGLAGHGQFLQSYTLTSNNKQGLVDMVIGCEKELQLFVKKSCCDHVRDHKCEIAVAVTVIVAFLVVIPIIVACSGTNNHN